MMKVAYLRQHCYRETICDADLCVQEYLKLLVNRESFAKGDLVKLNGVVTSF